MDSALSPREIQERIRSGAGLEEVAEAAGVPVDQVEPFAIPVLAELDHVIQVAQDCPVRRQSDPNSHRHLGEVVDRVCRRNDIDPTTLTWRCWRHQDRSWSLVASWPTTPGCDHDSATFRFDLRGRRSVPQDAGARWLVDDRRQGQEGSSRRHDPDDEPTLDLNDELAIVRAVTERRSAPEPVERAEESDDEQTEETSRVPGMSVRDGVYDFVPTTEAQMDTLYEMLAGFQEDSVNIYAGLDRPVAPPASEDSVPDRQADHEHDPATSSPEPPEAGDQSDRPGDDRAQKPETSTSQEEAEDHDPVASPTQPELVTDPAAPAKPKPAKPRRRNRRASVPSWDEIMFGGPTPHA